jgi:hypothetical protein
MIVKGPTCSNCTVVSRAAAATIVQSSPQNSMHSTSPGVLVKGAAACIREKMYRRLKKTMRM